MSVTQLIRRMLREDRPPQRNKLVLHPCLCGFRAESRQRMLTHRRQCMDWKYRKDPVGLANYRRWKTENQGNPNALTCPLCKRKTNHHALTCPEGFEEKERWAAVERNGIPKHLFKTILRELAKRYV